MTNVNYDFGLEEDFDNMTEELGSQIVIFSRPSKLGSDSQEVVYETGQIFGVDGIGFPIIFSTGDRILEIAMIQELNSENQVVKDGLFSIGDIKAAFKSDSSVEEESIIINNGLLYKIIGLTKVRALGNDKIVWIKAYGKKLPGR